MSRRLGRSTTTFAGDSRSSTSKQGKTKEGGVLEQSVAADSTASLGWLGIATPELTHWRRETLGSCCSSISKQSSDLKLSPKLLNSVLYFEACLNRTEPPIGGEYWSTKELLSLVLAVG